MSDQRRKLKETLCERDDFWDIESLLPTRKDKTVTRKPTPAPTPTAVEVEIAAHTPQASHGQSASSSPVPLSYTPETVPPLPERNAEATSTVRYVPPHTAHEGNEVTPLLDYRPDGVLLERVRVYEWASNFHYFDRFDKDATAFDAMEAPDMAASESFFSYFPQYVQMNRRQTAWYLWWRAQVRCGNFPDTDYAYILLYIFELINLDVPDRAVAARRRDSMASVWMAYRRTYPRLDQYMCEWLCDYCLVHCLPAPLDILAPALDSIISGSRLKEFYLLPMVTAAPAGKDADLSTARILLRHCCQYDYHRSKFAVGEHKHLFDATIPAAIAAALPILLGGGGASPAVTMLESTVTRDAYTGALCSYRHKRRIVVTYTSFSRSHELRFLMGDMVKHVENRLRAWIGVRSRLSTAFLPIPLRDALDAYLNPLAPTRAPSPAKKKEAPRPDYETLYDAPMKDISISDAAAIEARSWETTRILTEAFDGQEDIPAVEAPPPLTPTPAPDPEPATDNSPAANSLVTNSLAANSLASLLAPYRPFLAAILAGNEAAARSAARAIGKMPDALADEINALTTECEIFDMVLEDDGMGSYAAVEDYRDALQDILQD